MTRERLVQLSMEELLHLAEIFDVDVESDLEDDRGDLENQVFEAIEESRKSREDLNTFPVSYHQQKFENLDELFGEQGAPNEWGFEFPQSYNVTRIELMLRDPSWAFAYWDISIHDKTDVLKHEEFTGLLLRLSDTSDPDDIHTIMDIPISLNDTSWYLNLPSLEASYKVQLLAKLGDLEKELAESPRINVPLGMLSKQFEVLESFETDALIFLSGIEKLDERGVNTEIPQRILKIRDTWEE